MSRETVAAGNPGKGTGIMEKALCPVCGKYELSYEFEVCQVCGWEHNRVQEKRPNFTAGPNLGKSLNMCRKEWQERILFEKV